MACRAGKVRARWPGDLATGDGRADRTEQARAVGPEQLQALAQQRLIAADPGQCLQPNRRRRPRLGLRPARGVPERVAAG